MTSSLLPWTLQSLLSELYYNNAPLPVPRRAVEPIITSMLQSPKTSLRLANKTLDKTPSALVKCLKACALNATGKSSEGKSVTKQVLGDPKGMGEAGCILLLTHLVELFKLHREFPTAAEAALTAHSDRKDVCLAVMGIFLRLGDFKKVQQVRLLSNVL